MARTKTDPIKNVSVVDIPPSYDFCLLCSIIVSSFYDFSLDNGNGVDHHPNGDEQRKFQPSFCASLFC
jgi:hypothetical protein